MNRSNGREAASTASASEYRARPETAATTTRGTVRDASRAAVPVNVPRVEAAVRADTPGRWDGREKEKEGGGGVECATAPAAEFSLTPPWGCFSRDVPSLRPTSATTGLLASGRGTKGTGRPSHDRPEAPVVPETAASRVVVRGWAGCDGTPEAAASCKPPYSYPISPILITLLACACPTSHYPSPDPSGPYTGCPHT